MTRRTGICNKLTKEILQELYCKKELSMKEIAKLFSCHSSSVEQAIKRHKIKVRDYRTNRFRQKLRKNKLGNKNPNYKHGKYSELV